MALKSSSLYGWDDVYITKNGKSICLVRVSTTRGKTKVSKRYVINHSYNRKRLERVYGRLSKK